MSSLPVNVTTPAGVLPNGTAVTLHGLVSAAQYNGLTGTVMSHLAAKGRYAVVLPGPQKKTLSLKPANLSVAKMDAATLLRAGDFRYLPPTGPAAGAPYGPSQDGSLSGFSPLAAAVSSLEASALVVGAIIAQDPRADRAVGAMVGMCVADAIGHPLEFMPVVDDPFATGSGFDLATLRYTNPLNAFKLQPGQWTDDASMGLCLADSLLSSAAGRINRAAAETPIDTHAANAAAEAPEESEAASATGATRDYDGSDLRARFHAWWFKGMNNAFEYDDSRGDKTSVGLGGNISQSLYAIKLDGSRPTPTYQANTEDSGNGSLMRLAPVPCMYWRDLGKARAVAAASSVATHPGAMAARACEFMSYVIAKAIAAADPVSVAHQPAGAATGISGAGAFLAATAEEFLAMTGAQTAEPGFAELHRLLRSSEPEGSKERNWNWRADRLEIGVALEARGATYNGYPVSPGYFGAFSVDGLALALHCVYHTDSFDHAVERCVNFLGDADSTGSMVGQMAGAIYGAQAIDPRLIANLQRWDRKGLVALRAALLFAAETIE